ncbi:MAG: hypothetical protein U5N86_10830 [Planctomycetota bacterium]|nr:hypothetical protein [Planctomycetota bacterium]
MKDSEVFLARNGEGDGPVLAGTDIHLLADGTGSNNAVSFPAEAKGMWRKVQAAFRLDMDGAVRGASFVLLNTSHFGRKGKVFAMHRAKAPGDESPCVPRVGRAKPVGLFGNRIRRVQSSHRRPLRRVGQRLRQATERGVAAFRRSGSRQRIVPKLRLPQEKRFRSL